MHKFRPTNQYVNISLILAAASSFFTIPDLHIGGVHLPQLFYVFLLVATVCFIIKLSNERSYRAHLRTILRSYALPIALFLIVILGSILISFFTHAEAWPYFIGDYMRVVVLALHCLILITQATDDIRLARWTTYAMYLPLLFTPLFLLRDTDMARQMIPWVFANYYTLQGFLGNETSLAVWIVALLAFLSTFFFNTMNTATWKKNMILCAVLILSAGLLWWTQSRAALLYSISASIAIGLLSVRKKYWYMVVPVIGIACFAIGLFILPIKARLSVFLRFYPDQTQQLLLRTESVASIHRGEITKSILLKAPSFTHSQNRAELWHLYGMHMLSHPLGASGPAIFETIPVDANEGEHNILLQAGLWGGWIGFALFFAIAGFVIQKSLMIILCHRKNVIAYGTSVAFLGVFWLSLLNSYLDFKLLWILGSLVIVHTIILTGVSNAQEPHRQ